MIKNLRKKFIIVAMCSMFLVLGAIMVILNTANYISVVKNAEHLFTMIEENNGKFPAPPSESKPGKPKAEEDEREKPQEKKLPEQKDGEPDKEIIEEEPLNLSPESAYDTRFFTVWLDNTGKVTSCHMGNIAAVSEKEAKAFARKIFQKNSRKGFDGIYRYRNVSLDTGNMIIFLDRRNELVSFRNTVIISIFISAAGLFTVFILVVLFSRIVFRPVAQSYQKQKRFITDASHEIKTPLTIIDANIEVIEMENGVSQWTTSTRNQIRRLNVLTEQLVMLSKLEEEESCPAKEEFSLSKLVRECADSFSSLIITDGKKLETAIEESIFFQGDKKSITRLINLLIDNAVKYSTPKSTIRISLGKYGKKICLEVFNQTEHIPQGNLSILFERFYRMDSSRNSQTGGTGIGLSVAHAIVRSHRGQISAYSKDGTSISVTVEFR